MKLSEITEKDIQNMSEIFGNGQLGYEDNAGVDGCMTMEEIIRADEIMSIVRRNIKRIIKENKQGKNEKE
jgi:hypothetical protein